MDLTPDFLPEPTRFFSVGQPVRVGRLENSVVVEVLYGGKAYVVESKLPSRKPAARGENAPTRQTLAYPWMKVFPVSGPTDESLFVTDDVKFQTMSKDIMALLEIRYSFGLDTNPAYQRPYVWNETDQVKLVETVFDRGSIGTFTFNRRDYSFDGPLYEIVDGKQRLRALSDFYEDRISVRGRRFSQLSQLDQVRFLAYGVTMLETAEADEVTLLKLFLRLNRGGRPVDEGHIEEVRARLTVLTGVSN